LLSFQHSLQRPAIAAAVELSAIAAVVELSAFVAASSNCSRC